MLAPQVRQKSICEAAASQWQFDGRLCCVQQRTHESRYLSKLRKGATPRGWQARAFSSRSEELRARWQMSGEEEAELLRWAANKASRDAGVLAPGPLGVLLAEAQTEKRLIDAEAQERRC